MARRILLIDDNPANTELLGINLEMDGYEIDTAGNGREAQLVVEQRVPDVILVDLMMPVMDGLQFVQWLRNEAGHTMPVFVLTAAVERETEKRVLEAGANRVLYKPVDIDELGRLLRAL